MQGNGSVPELTWEESRSSYATWDFPMLHGKFLSYMGRSRAHRNFPCHVTNQLKNQKFSVVLKMFLSSHGKKLLFAGYPCRIDDSVGRLHVELLWHILDGPSIGTELVQAE
jgi:hypothetical protein